MMRGPKIVVIGAGSYFFGRPAIWNMVSSEILRNGTLALVDTDPKVLETMMSVARRAIDYTGAPTKLIGSTDRRAVMDGADFIALTFSFRNAHYRGVDTAIAAKYGVTMCSSDTIGPGGVFRALREIPEVLNIAQDTEELCPNAWVINFINPTSCIGIALKRHANIGSFALCDGNHEPHSLISRLKYVGILDEDATSVSPEIERDLDLDISGVNHNTWVTRFNYQGRDMFPVWREKLAEEAANEEPNPKAKPRYNLNYQLRLFDIYGAIPTAISHTKEYVPFFQGYGVTPNDPEPIICFDAENRAREMDESWLKNEDYASGKLTIDQFMKEGKGDHATDIMESMWGKLGKPFYINTFNDGAVTNMPDDAFLELRCDVDMKGPRPQPSGEMPRGLLALQHQTLDTHELTVEAAVTYDRDILLRALVTDPIINNIGDAKNIMEELLEVEREHLPEQWYK